MRHLIITISGIICLLCLTFCKVSAQENNGWASPRFGIKGGVNFSALYVNDAQKDQMLFGFNLGLFAKLPVSRFIAIQPEIYFTTKGSEVTYNDAFVDGVGRYHFNYLELPILLVMNLTPNFNIQAGPYVAYMLSGKVTNESGDGSFDFEKYVNTDNYNRVDAGAMLGAGLDFRGLGIGARYAYGFTKVGQEHDYSGVTYTFPDARNGVISLYVTLALH